MNNTFKITNITQKDIDNSLIRIVVANKKFFPGSENIEPKTYNIKVKINSEVYDAKYRVGNERSGTLRIGTDIYKHKLCLKFGDTLRINILKEFELYELIKE